jgi:hypothetical protein
LSGICVLQSMELMSVSQNFYQMVSVRIQMLEKYNPNSFNSKCGVISYVMSTFVPLTQRKIWSGWNSVHL